MTDLILQSQCDDENACLQQRFCEGSDTAFDQVIDCYSPSIQRLVCRLLAWDQEVDDVVQDVFAAAFANRRKFRAGSSLKTWLFSITINICRTRNQRRLLWQKFIKGGIFLKTAPVSNPDHISLEQEQAEKVRLAARRLPQKYRDVVVLKYLEELSTEQILGLLKINEKVFYTRLSRARNILQQDLAAYMGTKNE